MGLMLEQWVVGLMFDFGAVGHGWATTTSGFCLLYVMGEICSPWMVGFAHRGFGFCRRGHGFLESMFEAWV